MDTNLEILVQLKDEASAAFKRMGQDIGNASEDMTGKLTGVKEGISVLSKYALAGATALGGLAVAFGVSAIKSFGEAETAMARVRTTVERTVDAFNDLEYDKFQDQANKAFGGTGDVLDYLNGVIDKTSQSFIQLGFDDEATAQSLSRLFQRTHDMTEAQKLLVTATDLARARQIDLSSATDLVGQVLSGNGRVLKQYGIEISDTLTPLQALGELQRQVGGQASAFAQTFPGQMAILNEAWSNMKDEIGKVLVEALTPFVKEFSAWLLNPETQKAFLAWTKNLKEWADVTIPVLIETFKEWGRWINNIVHFFLDVAGAIDTVLQKLDQLFAKWDRFRGNVAGGASIVGGALTSVGHALGFAEGGIVTKPTLAMIGEAGESEAVIPLSKLGSIGGSGAVNINISGAVMTVDAANEMAKIIMQQVKRVSRIGM